MRSFHRLSLLAVPAALLVGAPLAPAHSATHLFFEGDVVRGIPATGPTGPGCVLNSQFKHNEEIVWRVRVLDGRTGKQLDGKALKSLMVELPDGQKIPLRFGGHPNRGPQTDHFWSGSWLVPASYPAGSFTYKVVATDKRNHATSWQPFNVGLSQLTVQPGEATPPKK